jgi:hypothetical protein
MTEQHPLTPPPELVQQWASEKCYDERDWLYELHITTRAAQWGAGQELEACVSWLIKNQNPRWALALQDARCPKPLSLKEQAMRVLVENGTNLDGRMELDSTDIETIRSALEALPND